MFVVFVHSVLVVYWQHVKCISERKKRIITKTRHVAFYCIITEGRWNILMSERAAALCQVNYYS